MKRSFALALCCIPFVADAQHLLVEYEGTVSSIERATSLAETPPYSIGDPIRGSLIVDTRLAPRDRLPVVGADPAEDLPRQPADEVLLALDVGPAQAATEHPAHVRTRVEQQDRCPLAGRGDGRQGAAGSRSEDANVG